MALVSEVRCRRCGHTYSGLRKSCPMCGAPRVNQPTRVPPTTTAATPRTKANAQSNINIRWQFVLGAVVLVAVILVVVILLLRGNTSNKSSVTYVPKYEQTTVEETQAPEDSEQTEQTTQSGSQSYYVSADLPSPSPSPDPTPEASPTPPIESMAITFLNKSVSSDFRWTEEGVLSLDLDLNIYPVVDDPVTWTSSNEKILSVDDRGIVTIVGANPDGEVHATIIAECCGMQQYVTIYIPAYQAVYLTTNLYDPETYEQDNLEWDTIIYATPTPRH